MVGASRVDAKFNASMQEELPTRWNSFFPLLCLGVSLIFEFLRVIFYFLKESALQCSALIPSILAI